MSHDAPSATLLYYFQLKLTFSVQPKLMNEIRKCSVTLDLFFSLSHSLHSHPLLFNSLFFFFFSLYFSFSQFSIYRAARLSFPFHRFFFFFFVLFDERTQIARWVTSGNYREWKMNGKQTRPSVASQTPDYKFASIQPA